MKLYFRYFMIQLRSQMQYKVSFFFTLLGQLITSFSAFLGIFFLMRRFHAVEGFSTNEVMLCFAAVLMAFSIAETLHAGLTGSRRCSATANSTGSWCARGT